MLSGIKTGKKKKRKTTTEKGGATTASTLDEGGAKKKPRPSGNLSAAQLLKQQLKSGIVPSVSAKRQEGGLEARLERVTASDNNKEDHVVVLTGAAAATTSDRPDYRPGTF